MTHQTNTTNPVDFPNPAIDALLEDFVIVDASMVVATPEQLYDLVAKTVLECVYQIAQSHNQPNPILHAQQQLFDHFRLEPPPHVQA
jgi:hypothetical protein